MKKPHRVTTVGLKYYWPTLDQPNRNYSGQLEITVSDLLRLANDKVGVCQPGQMPMQLGRRMGLSELDAHTSTIGVEVGNSAWASA